MYNKERYGKILTPMVTPFKQDQSVDYVAAASIAKKLVKDQISDTIVIGGTTGEFFTMSFEERVELFKVVKKAVNGQIPLIPGVGTTSTIETIALAGKAEELGFDAVMVVSPYYTKPSQEQLYLHFKKVAESVNINIMIYNIPIFAGVNVNSGTLAKLAQIKNIVAVKEEAELNPKQMTDYINVTPDDFIIYCGDDTMILEAYAQGGEKRIGGIISGMSHIIGKSLKKMIEMFIGGNIQEAAKMQQKFLPLFRIMGQNGRFNPCALIKEAMKMVGFNSGIPRLPLTPGTAEEIAEIRKVMENLNIL